MAGMYDYERNLANVQDQYAQDNATNQFARFVSQQRFSRNKDAANQSFQRGFPSNVVRMNQGQNQRVRSGMFGERLGNHFGDFSKNMGYMEADQAGQESQFAQAQAMRDNQYQKALLLLQEQMQAERGQVDPYAAYRSVWSQ